MTPGGAVDSRGSRLLAGREEPDGELQPGLDGNGEVGLGWCSQDAGESTCLLEEDVAGGPLSAGHRDGTIPPLLPGGKEGAQAVRCQTDTAIGVGDTRALRECPSAEF
ncbi:hypothetical protein HRbin28_01309 [bacterium HR28]|nr:hypothetical protein HRbin28_01309 [bacterium HR28]